MINIDCRRASSHANGASHPLTEDRLARMNSEDRRPSGPPLLTSDEWASLKAIWDTKN